MLIFSVGDQKPKLNIEKINKFVSTRTFELNPQIIFSYFNLINNKGATKN
jgi:hypothetical protein